MARRHEVNESRHHLWYPAREYETHDWLHDLREQHIVLMNHAGHVALHKAVEPPLLPSMEMVALGYQIAEDYLEKKVDEWFEESSMDALQLSNDIVHS